MSDETIQKLSFLEQQLTSLVSQKSSLQKQVFEIENASKELQSCDEAYQIIGSIMIKKTSKDLNDDLISKKDTISIRLKSIETQEKKLRNEINDLRKDILKEIN